MQVSLPLCIKDCHNFQSGKETPHWRTAYLSSFTVWRNKLFSFLIFTTKVQLFSAVFEVYARNILLIASFRAEIAKRWSLKTFLELWVVVHVSSNFFHFFSDKMNSSAFAVCWQNYVRGNVIYFILAFDISTFTLGIGRMNEILGGRIYDFGWCSTPRSGRSTKAFRHTALLQ
jgi:hypothetical protein